MYDGGAMQDRQPDTDMQSKKATTLRSRVKAEVIQIRDDPSEVSWITNVPNLTVPPMWGEDGTRAEPR